MPYSLDPQAEKELEDAFIYYREQGSCNLASAFIAEFERVATLLCANTGFGIPAGDTTRSYPLRRFSVFIDLSSHTQRSTHTCRGPSASSAWVLARSSLVRLQELLPFCK